MAYRTEHPNPQFERSAYECLNGRWEFETGRADGKSNKRLSSEIEVPFCPESAISGICNTDFMPDCVYSRELYVNESDLSGRLVLHFGAVDYRAEIYVNGVKAGEHTGGYTAFETEITPYVSVGKNRVTVAVHDDARENTPSGKQSGKRESYGCFYTRVTGIWQTVWLERTPKAYIRDIRYTTDLEKGRVYIELITEGKAHTDITVYYGENVVGYASGDGYYRHGYEIELAEKHLWELGHGRLYTVVVRFGDDEVKSYFGLRDVKYEKRKFLLNGKSVFQRLVLDQGYYPDGLYTAPSAEELRRDIELSLRLGFNGARLHQRVFEPRYLYECDRLGYMVWGEYASWGVRYEDLEALGGFIAEWTECVEQLRNHPSIVTWCPLNEAWTNLDDAGRERDIRFVESVYAVTKLLDPSRPCVDVSGGYHGRFTDVYDFHCYHGAEEIKGYIKTIEEDGLLVMDTLYGSHTAREGSAYDGRLPLHASEYGGVAFKPTESAEASGSSNAWSYSTCATEQSFIEGYIGTTEQFLKCDKICGFCYTQLYDVEQEQNGLYAYDRRPKLSEEGMAKIAACNRSVAAVEVEGENVSKKELLNERADYYAKVPVFSKNII